MTMTLKEIAAYISRATGYYVSDTASADSDFVPVSFDIMDKLKDSEWKKLSSEPHDVTDKGIVFYGPHKS